MKRMDRGVAGAVMPVAVGIAMTSVLLLPLAVAGALEGLVDEVPTAGPAPLVPISGSCDGRDIRGYENGAMPSSALCPLWGASSHRLRADAAAAFESLSREYADEFGGPLCVTDSYRTYAEQVRLRAAKPALAAVPGTSNHGWGTAADLCGGVQQFGTRQHDWMRVHAPRHRWVLPQWARRTGSKPEPWHWEFQS